MGKYYVEKIERLKGQLESYREIAKLIQKIKE